MTSLRCALSDTFEIATVALFSNPSFHPLFPSSSSRIYLGCYPAPFICRHLTPPVNPSGLLSSPPRPFNSRSFDYSFAVARRHRQAHRPLSCAHALSSFGFTLQPPLLSTTLASYPRSRRRDVASSYLLHFPTALLHLTCTQNHTSTSFDIAFPSGLATRHLLRFSL